MAVNNRTDKLKVGIIGAGNVATHLFKGFLQQGVETTIVYSRSVEHAEALASLSAATVATNSLDFITLPHADVYLIAVPDQAISDIVEHAKFPVNAIVVHTSGTQPLSVLDTIEKVEAGVFYPLQTFSKEKSIDWRRIPLCLEASQPETEIVLMELAKKLSEVVVPMEGQARKQLHVAAVFACNFANHLWGVAHEVLQGADLPFQLLEPLLQETLTKALHYPPFTVQTGPAQRKDESTIQAHLHLLNALPQYQELYKVITNSIQTTATKRLSTEGEPI